MRAKEYLQQLNLDDSDERFQQVRHRIRKEKRGKKCHLKT